MVVRPGPLARLCLPLWQDKQQLNPSVSRRSKGRVGFRVIHRRVE